MKKNHVFLFIKQAMFAVVALMMTLTASAENSATELVKELEATYLKGEGVEISFEFGSTGKMSFTIVPKTNQYILQAPNNLITSDGITTWNYSSDKKQVVIDKAITKKNSFMMSDLVNFSTNYTATVTVPKKGFYTLVLTPKKSVKSVYDQAEVVSLSFEIERKKDSSLKIHSITAARKGKKAKLGNVKIAVLSKASPAMFTFTAPAGAKTIDLRED